MPRKAPWRRLLQLANVVRDTPGFEILEGLVGDLDPFAFDMLDHLFIETRVHAFLDGRDDQARVGTREKRIDMPPCHFDRPRRR